MRVASDHLLATVSDPLLDYLNRSSCHDQSAHSVVPEAVHATTFRSELAKQWVKMLVENGGIHQRCLPSSLKDKAFGSAVQMSFQHLHNVRLDVDPAGCILGFG